MDPFPTEGKIVFCRICRDSSTNTRKDNNTRGSTLMKRFLRKVKRKTLRHSNDTRDPELKCRSDKKESLYWYQLCLYGKTGWLKP